MNLSEKIIKQEKVYSGNIVDFEKATVIMPNGKESTRDIITHPGASVILPINDNNEIYLVKQFRAPINTITYEIPAGKLDLNEDPKECALRELKEETGLIPNYFKKILAIYSAPGFCNEILHMYIAKDLIQSQSNVDEDEFLSVVKLPLSKCLEMVLNGQIMDSKTIIAILYAQSIANGDIKI